MPVKITMVHYIYDIVLMEPSEEEVAYTNTLGKNMHARGWLIKSREI